MFTPVILAEITLLGMFLVSAIVTTGTIVYQQSQAKKARKESRGASQAAAEAQAEMAGRARGVAMAPISEKQMQKIIKQREISSLVDHYIEQEQEMPTVFTLPTARPSSPVVRANEAIHKFLTGVA